MEQNTAGCACWTIAEPGFSPEHLAKYETVLTLGNGYLGQRAALEERYIGQTRNLFVCGTFDRYHTSEVSELPNLPDVTRLDLFVNGERFSLLTGTTLEHERSLDLYTAELHRKTRWRAPDGAELTLSGQQAKALAESLYADIDSGALTVDILDTDKVFGTGGSRYGVTLYLYVDGVSRDFGLDMPLSCTRMWEYVEGLELNDGTEAVMDTEVVS